jgi:hypothetical protein
MSKFRVGDLVELIEPVNSGRDISFTKPYKITKVDLDEQYPDLYFIDNQGDERVRPFSEYKLYTQRNTQAERLLELLKADVIRMAAIDYPTDYTNNVLDYLKEQLELVGLFVEKKTITTVSIVNKEV